MTLDAVARVLDRMAANRPFSPTPSVLAVTNLTEMGRRYSLEDLAHFAELAREHGMRLHVDGARFANALAADPALINLFDVGVSTLAFGCTKNGQGPVEAVVTVAADVHTRVGRAAKQLGWTASKMRFATAGVAASLGSGEFAMNALTANLRAALLAERLTEAGIVLATPVDGNLVFVRLPQEVVPALDAWCHVSDWDGQGLVRLACSWDHTVEDVERLVAGIVELVATSVPSAS
jgi:threonine aldolase